MREKKVEIPIYGGSILFILGDLNKLSEKYELGCVSNYDGFVFKKDNDNYLIAFESEKIDKSIIAHESCHLVNLIFKDCGVNLDLENDEPQCYLLEWVFNQCEIFINERIQEN